MCGIKPVVIAIIAQALWELGRKAITGLYPALMGVASVGLYLWASAAVVLLARGWSAC